MLTGFSYPKLYAEGFSKPARDFNCVQRGHQQALEMLPQFMALSLVGAIRFPITCAIGGILYNIGRLSYAEGYSSGDPAARYANKGRWIYFGYFIQLVTASATAVQCML